MNILNSNVFFDAFGRTVLDKMWNFNYAMPYNILHYVKSGRAHYTKDDETHEFCEGYLYILSGFADIKRTLIPGEIFDHMYFDFSTNKILKNDVTIIDTTKHPILHSVCETISLFFREADIRQATFPNYRYNEEILEMTHSYFDILIRTINSITPIFTDIDPRIAKALDYIHKNFNDGSLSIQTLARHSHMSVPYFNALFCKETKSTPHKYIMEFRMNHAYKLLLSNESIKYVADATGYSNVYSFSKAFKQRFTISPGSVSSRQKA